MYVFPFCLLGVFFSSFVVAAVVVFIVFWL